MKSTQTPRHHLRNPLLALLFLAAAAAAAQIAMAAKPEQAAAAQEAAVHIVYVDRPEDADPEEFNIRTLSLVLGRYRAVQIQPDPPPLGPGLERENLAENHGHRQNSFTESSSSCGHISCDITILCFGTESLLHNPLARSRARLLQTLEQALKL
ncbi:hypothetical protein D1007_48271 [Hordeum vulgare]|nr:hypothetical protein D1007_48271 [Hordeum vulgare]